MNLLPAFEIAEPTTPQECVALHAARAGARYLGGGTDLVPNLRRGLDAPELLISLDKVSGMKRLEERGDDLVIGAGVRIEELERSGLVQRLFPAVSMAAATIAAPGHRAMATVGGNLCLDTRCVFYNQSEWWRAANRYCLKKDGDTCHVQKKGDTCVAAYSGDLAPSLIALDAVVETETRNGRRSLPVEDMFGEDGKDYLALEPGELLVSIRIPLQPERRSGYLKSRVRQSMDFPLAGVAAALRLEDGAIAGLRVAVTGTNSRPVLVGDCETLDGNPVSDELLKKLGKMVSRAVQPMRTTIVPSLYRRHMAVVLAKRLVAQLCDEGRDQQKGAA